MPVQSEEAGLRGVHDAPEEQRVCGIVLCVSLLVAVDDLAFWDEAYGMELLGVVRRTVDLIRAREGQQKGHGQSVEEVIPSYALAATPMDGEAAKRSQECEHGQRPRGCLRPQQSVPTC